MKRSSPFHSPADVDAVAADWIIRRDAGLSAAEEVELSRWLAEDPGHAEAMARHERAWRLLGRPRSGGRAGEMLRALPARVARRRNRRLAASVSVLAVALILFAMIPVRAPVSPVSPGRSLVSLPRKQTLPDGSVVELKNGASIAVGYSDQFRHVTLQGGEALFQVEKDPARPFVVSAAGVDVRALGTVFLVQLGETHVDVIVTNGTVAVETVRDGGPLPATPEAAPIVPTATVLEAGTRVTVDTTRQVAASPPTPISSAEIADLLAWRAPSVEFTDVPLTEAVAMLNQHSPVRLVVEDPTLASLPVNGRFRADNGETLARLLESSFGLFAERRGDQIVLRKVQPPRRD